MKRSISLLLAVILALSCAVPVLAHAEQKIYYYSDTGSYNAVVLDNGDAKITGTIQNTCNLERVVVPAYIEGHPVRVLGDNSLIALNAKVLELPDTLTTIGKNACKGMKIEDLVLPQSVTSIGDYAFFYCESLQSVTFPYNLQSIGESAFTNCALTSITIPDSVKTIGSFAFSDNALSAVNIGAGVTTIGEGAFIRNYLVNVAVPANVTSIGRGAFSSDYIKTAKVFNKNCYLENFSVFRNRRDTKVVIYADGGSVQSYCATNSTYYVFRYLHPVVKAVKLKTTAFHYDGTFKKPVVVAADTNGAVISSAYYTVAYAANRYVGTAKAVVKFKGAYSGAKTLYFNILPRPTKLAGLTAGRRCFAAKWAKQAVQTHGYQIQYATNAKFSGAKVLTVKGATKNAALVKNLAAGRLYYARIRTYKVVGGKVYASAWSAAARVKTK
ncbi:MAG: leucine-rich repeat protein [Clostridia bacterium]|nr:leucine-rich repeat protein [Clostridia bacterium]